MRKNYLRLFLLIAFLFSVYSCVHDEIYTATDSSSTEYHSKSFWKEDEKYIKNIIRIYAEHEFEIKRMSGVPQWEYAMSMGKYDETFMIVPIVKNNKVVSTLSCARFDKKVYFKYDNTPENIVFFDRMLFGKYTRYKTESSKGNTTSAQKGSVCVSGSYSVWFPDNENDYWGNGHWESYYYLNCYSYQDYSNPDFNEGGSSGGFDYGGGSGGSTDPNNPENLTPCEKTKTNLENQEVLAKIQELKTQSTQGGEIGVKFKADGTASATITGTAHSVNFGDKTGYTGAYHNHTPTGIPMLSPPDIDQLLGFARAQPTSNPANVTDAYIGMVAPNGMHYVIQFNGNYQDSLINFSQDQLNQLKDDYIDLANDLTSTIVNGTTYINSNGTINTLGVETLFFATLKKMGLEGKVNLQRIENGIIKNINLDSNNQPTPTNC